MAEETQQLLRSAVARAGKVRTALAEMRVSGATGGGGGGHLPRLGGICGTQLLVSCQTAA